MTKITRNPAAEKIAGAILNEYHPESVADMQEALKEIFGPMFESMLKGEMDSHLGYASNSKEKKTTDNRRNGYTDKTLKTTMGEVPIKAPRDRDGSFQPVVVPKNKTDVSEIEDKVLSMYARGMSQRDISATIQDIYGFEVSAEMISNMTDSIMKTVNEWRSRPLQKCYPFVFVDCLYVSVRDKIGSHEEAVYVILGYTLEGKKEILGMWMNTSESKSYWMQIFDELKGRGVEDIFFISMDGVSGLEDGAKSIFPGVKVQRCIVHLIRNSIKYVPSKDYKAFTADLKKVYGAINLDAANEAFEAFQTNWAQYKGAVDVWRRNYSHVEQLYNYGSAVRKVMYTTNAIESVNSSLRKVTKKGSFPSEDAVFKALYLRVTELEKKWERSHQANWSMVLNQLMIDDAFSERIRKYSLER